MAKRWPRITEGNPHQRKEDQRRKDEEKKTTLKYPYIKVLSVGFPPSSGKGSDSGGGNDYSDSKEDDSFMDDTGKPRF